MVNRSTTTADAVGRANRHLPRGRPVGVIYPDTIPVLVGAEVLDDILDYSQLDLRRETGGFLVGRYEPTPRPHVQVRHFLPAAAEGETARLRFTHATWSALTRQVEERCPGERVLGWHHTHPNLGVFLSGYDRFIHRHFFSEPWQVAMVVDPVRGEFAFFQWRGQQIVDCGFALIRDPWPQPSEPVTGDELTPSVPPPAELADSRPDRARLSPADGSPADVLSSEAAAIQILADAAESDVPPTTSAEA